MRPGASGAVRTKSAPAESLHARAFTASPPPNDPLCSEECEFRVSLQSAGNTPENLPGACSRVPIQAARGHERGCDWLLPEADEEGGRGLSRFHAKYR